MAATLLGCSLLIWARAVTSCARWQTLSSKFLSFLAWHSAAEEWFSNCHLEGQRLVFLQRINQLGILFKQQPSLPLSDYPLTGLSSGSVCLVTSKPQQTDGSVWHAHFPINVVLWLYPDSCRRQGSCCARHSFQLIPDNCVIPTGTVVWILSSMGGMSVVRLASCKKWYQHNWIKILPQL